MSYEQTRKLSGPCIGTKFQDEISTHNELRAETVAAAAEVAMWSLDAAPPQLKERLDEQANLLNVPRVGCERNTAFPFMQMNIVSTQPAGQAGTKIKRELGKVGGKHSDTHDAAGGITTMITDSDIDPETEEWGWFVICDLGVAVELRRLIMVNFCGLREHGGFAPTAKPGFTPKPWSHRFTVPWRLRSDAKELRDEAEERYEQFAWHQRKFVPNGVHLKLGQEARLRAKSLALSGTWGNNTSKRANANANASSSRKRVHKRNPRKRSQGNTLGTRSTTTSGCRNAQMSHVEISPLSTAHRRRYVSLSSLPVVQDPDNEGGEWTDMDVDDVDDEYDSYDLQWGEEGSETRQGMTDKDWDEEMDIDTQEDRMDVDGPPSRRSPEDVSRSSLRKRKRPVVMSPEDSSDDEVHMDDNDYEEDAMVPSAKTNNVTSYQPLLQSFSAVALRSQLAVYSSMADNVEQTLSEKLLSGSQALDEFLNQYESASRFSPELAYALDRVWPSLRDHARALQCFDLRIALERRRYMLANAIAWRWLTEDCVARCKDIISLLVVDAQGLQRSTDWFTRLVRDIFQSYRARCAATLHARDYLPNISNPDQVWDLRGYHRAASCPIAMLTCDEVLDLLACWLHFPTNTRRISATFVTRLVEVTGNVDILLLNTVWHAHQTVQIYRTRM
ncbi:hypothetical protein GSI_12426 [Ganoderma sinense ZZ0214-1]|uniref:Uncharacterized protein n=1 Tax=Ganoderma sinense ZZ0214-1 TaxID=1077348 RepID=A0A2G8RVH2_9APHY|nr:hypothetical protein GSI_12426 [Ganoderma sinense ZZ0214-1]